jgi:hypothetical protein
MEFHDGKNEEDKILARSALHLTLSVAVIAIVGIKARIGDCRHNGVSITSGWP